MKHAKKCLYSLLLGTVLLLALCLPAAASTLSSALSKSADYMRSAVSAPQFGSVGGEWAVLGLARSGRAVSQEYWDAYYAAVEEYVTAREGVLHKRKHTEYARAVLALTAIGADPTDVGGYNLLTPLGDFEKTLLQGINGPIWALLALDCGSYAVPANEEAETQATRQIYVDDILRRQLADGGWSLAGEAPADPDVTAMALQALAKYQAQDAVKAATDRALDCLSRMQGSDGGYAGWEVANSESVVQVIVALCELGIALEDSRFVKGGSTLLENLLRYQNADGSFSHTSGGEGSSQIASEQGLYGLAAAQRAAEGKSSLYRMGDRTIRSYGSGDAVGLPNKHEDVRKIEIVADVSFADISSHKNKTAIEALAARGIVTGYDGKHFGPDDTVTRAQFAAMVVRALGLPTLKTNGFADVASDAWYAPCVGSAHRYGIVTGKNADRFDPDGTISRQEAAVMTARAAKLCGMDTALGESERRDLLAPFSDGARVASWARESVAFCCREGILDASARSAAPLRAVTRGEMAQMLCALLGCAKLL